MTTESLQTVAPVTIDIHKVAWLIMMGGFMLFCSASLTVTGGFYFFAFRSNIPIDAIVEVGRGTAVIEDELQQRAPRSGTHSLTNLPASVSIDSQSQAAVSLRVFDGEEPATLATLTLDGNTNLSVSRAQQPRFGWSQGAYILESRLLRGTLEILINPLSARDFRLQIDTPQGESILLETPGRYSLSVNEDRVRLSTRQGVAALLTADRLNNRLVTSGDEAVILVERPAPVLGDTPINLLDNGGFTFSMLGDDSTANLPTFWECSDSVDDLPRGAYRADIWESRYALRFLRADGASSHGETTCQQVLADDKQDVSEYSYLEFEASFLINYHSLSECGEQGSECPIMFHMNYQDAEGEQRDWYKGFYQVANTQSNYPLRCLSCVELHTQINEQVWYTYSTGNLVGLLPENERPQHINFVRFYASGHQYDVFVSEVALLAGRRDVVPPIDNLLPTSPDS